MIGGCTTLHPIANVPTDLSQHFSDGGALHTGDRVIITTLAGTKHELRVRSVRDGVIYGDQDLVPFSEVASIDRRDFSPAKTTTLVVVVVGFVAGLAAAIRAGSHPNVGL
jgi:hypothetical protein